MIDRIKNIALVTAVGAMALCAVYARIVTTERDTLEARLATCAGNTSRLQAALTEQNAAIKRYNTESEAARAEVERARRDAEKWAARHDLRVAELRKWQRAAGEDECAATKRLLSEVPR